MSIRCFADLCKRDLTNIIHIECAECSDALSLLWIVFGGVLAITGATGVLYFVSGVNTSAGKLTVMVALGAPPR